MLNEFERLRKLGVKFNGSLLQEMALKLLHDNNIPINVSDIEQDTGKPISEVITLNWIQNFKVAFILYLVHVLPIRLQALLKFNTTKNVWLICWEI